MPNPDFKYLPNALTITRIVVTPLLLVLLFFDTLAGFGWAFTLFVLASISDWVDGKVARHYSAASRLGQFLDPIADKVLVLGTFIVLIFILPESVSVWLIVTIAFRDAVVTGLRVYMKSNGQTLKTSSAAKLKTTFQLTFLIGILLVLTLSKISGVIGGWAEQALSGPYVFYALVVVTAVTVYTGVLYFVKPELNDE